MHRYTSVEIKQARMVYVMDRRKEGYTDADIAESLKVAQSTISMWLRLNKADRATFNHYRTVQQERKRAIQRVQFAIRHARKHLSKEKIRDLVNDEIGLTVTSRSGMTVTIG